MLTHNDGILDKLFDTINQAISVASWHHPGTAFLNVFVKSSCAFGTDDWLGIANMRIHRPRMRKLLTVLKDCEPPKTIAMPSVRPCVGRTDPVLSGIQSIWFLNTAVCAK